MRYFNTKQAAEYLSAAGCDLTEATLQTMRSRGGGPRFQRNGQRAVYSEAELAAYAERRLGPLVGSTSEEMSTQAA